MDNLMKSVLSRVLSQEIGNQERWLQEDTERGLKTTGRREETIDHIKQFMVENDIDFRADFYVEAKFQ